jgi:hypothetical protein
MRRGGKGDAIPLIAFHNAPLLEAGFFTKKAFLVDIVVVFKYIVVQLDIDSI